jgi:predicted nucleic acid-binding protein
LVVIDTSIWSLAFRRAPDKLSAEEKRLVACWQRLILGDEVSLLGAIRQEALSGVRSAKQFELLRARLRAWDDEPVTADDYEEAARFSNTCRANGIAHSNVDILICAVAARRGYDVFTTDRDFDHYAKVLPIRLLPHPSA